MCTIEIFEKRKRVISLDVNLWKQHKGNLQLVLSNKRKFLLINLRGHKDQWEIKVIKEMRVREVRRAIVASLDSMGFLEVQYV